MIVATQRVCIDPCRDAIWTTLVEQQASSLFTSPPWMRVLTDTYGYTPQAYVAIDSNGDPVAGIPFCHVSDPLGDRIVSLPFSDYCDPLAATGDDWLLLADQLVETGMPLTLRCLHTTTPLADERFAQVKQARWHGMRLQDDSETMWRNLPQPVRWAVNRARRDGVVVTQATSEEMLRSFYELHVRVRKYKYGMLAQPYAFFQQIWHHFIVPNNGTLLLAIYEGNIIGGMLFLRWKNTLYYKFNASDPAYLRHQPNDLLMWEGIQYAQECGLSMFDFGLSDWEQEGLISFKHKFATDEGAITFLRHAPSGTSQRDVELRQMLGQLTSLLVDPSVPDSITEQGGKLLYRLFA